MLRNIQISQGQGRSRQRHATTLTRHCPLNLEEPAFWTRLRVELLNTRKWPTTFQLAAAMADYIDNFNNLERRDSYLGNISPTEREKPRTPTQSLPQLA